MSSLLTFQLRHQQQQQQEKEGHPKEEQQQSGLPSPPSSFCGDEAKAPLQQTRRDSLQTVFNDMSIKDYSSSLPENYTIDHSTPPIRRTPIATAAAAATGGLTIRNRKQSEVLLSGSLNSRRKSSSFNNRTLSESFNGQYKCTDCGKSYKHSNCLQKHRWEHSEEWEVTKKLSLTKHQQVQMLEAAAILVGMDRRTSSVSHLNEEQVKEEEQEEEEEEESIIIDDDNDDDKLSIDSDTSSIFMEDL